MSADSYNVPSPGETPAALAAGESAPPVERAREDLRIVIAGPPKTGNVWIEHILAFAYGLRQLAPPNVPDNTATSLREFVAAGHFAPGTIFHQHFEPTEELFDVLDSIQCHVVSMLRNPYDVFVSLFFYTQRFAEEFVDSGDPAKELIDRDISDPAVLRFLVEDFRLHLQLAVAWLECGRSIIVRYEDLHAGPLAEARRVTDAIASVPDDPLQAAVHQASARNLRRQSEGLEKHVRSGTVGDWGNHLDDEHLRIFRDQHADLVRKLGYDVL